jgi:hypothetical protein
MGIKVNKFLKMDFKGQTTILAAIFVLAGMIFLVPAITEKALAGVHATATGVCGPPGQTKACQFTFSAKDLNSRARWVSEPTPSGTFVTWSTVGNPQPSDEKGSVTYKIGEDTAILSFDNPVIGKNSCNVGGSVGGTCDAGSGQNAAFTYDVRGK